MIAKFEKGELQGCGEVKKVELWAASIYTLKRQAFFAILDLHLYILLMYLAA
jgi:hypothetical protein